MQPGTSPFLYFFDSSYKDSYPNDFISLPGYNKSYNMNFMYPNNRPFMSNPASGSPQEGLIKKNKDPSFVNEKPEKGKASVAGGIPKEEIIRWINSLDQEEKFYMLMIEDLSLVNIIIKMFWYQEDNGDNVFMINKDDKGKDINPLTADISEFFYIRKPEFDESSRSEKIKAQHDIIDAIRLLDTHNLYDTMCFSEEFVNDTEHMLNCFEIISDKNCFTSVCKPQWDPYLKEKIFNYPIWFTPNTYQSVASWVVGYMEKEIWIKYTDDRNFKTVKGSKRITESSPNKIIEDKRNLIQFWAKTDKNRKKKMVNFVVKSSKIFSQNLTDKKNETLKSLHEFFNNFKSNFLFKDKDLTEEEWSDIFNKMLEELSDEKLMEEILMTKLRETREIVPLLNRILSSEIKKSYSDKMANDLIQTEESEKNQKKKNNKKKKKMKKKAKSPVSEEFKKEPNPASPSPKQTAAQSPLKSESSKEVELKEIIIHELDGSENLLDNKKIEKDRPSINKEGDSRNSQEIMEQTKPEDSKNEKSDQSRTACKYCKNKTCEIHQYARNFTSSLKENCLKSINAAENFSKLGEENEGLVSESQKSERVSEGNRNNDLVNSKKHSKKEKADSEKNRLEKNQDNQNKNSSETVKNKKINKSDGELSNETKMICTFLNEQEKTEEEEENKSIYSVSSLIDDTSKSVPKKRCTSASQKEKDKKRRKGKSMANYLVEESESTTVRERSHSRSNKEPEGNSLVVLEDLFDEDKKKISKSKKKKIKKKLSKKGGGKEQERTKGDVHSNGEELSPQNKEEDLIDRPEENFKEKLIKGDSVCLKTPKVVSEVQTDVGKSISGQKSSKNLEDYKEELTTNDEEFIEVKAKKATKTLKNPGVKENNREKKPRGQAKGEKAIWTKKVVTTNSEAQPQKTNQKIKAPQTKPVGTENKVAQPSTVNEEKKILPPPQTELKPESTNIVVAPQMKKSSSMTSKNIKEGSIAVAKSDNEESQNAMLANTIRPKRVSITSDESNVELKLVKSVSENPDVLVKSNEANTKLKKQITNSENYNHSSRYNRKNDSRNQDTHSKQISDLTKDSHINKPQFSTNGNNSRSSDKFVGRDNTKTGNQTNKKLLNIQQEFPVTPKKVNLKEQMNDLLNATPELKQELSRPMTLHLSKSKKSCGSYTSNSSEKVETFRNYSFPSKEPITNDILSSFRLPTPDQLGVDLSTLPGRGLTTGFSGSSNTIYQEVSEDVASLNELSETNKLTARLFKNKVENDLFSFVNNITVESNKLHQHRNVIFKRIQHLVRTLFSENHSDARIYGSVATGLVLPKSDIDIEITGFEQASKFEIQEILQVLLDNLINFKWIKSSKPIFYAQIPVLKLEIEPSIPFLDIKGAPPAVLNYLGFTNHDNLELSPDRYMEDRVVIKVDITIQTLPFKPIFDPLYSTPEHLGKMSTDIMSQWLNTMPCLFRLSIFLKFLLQANSFNNTYQGGIGSYCLMNMIVAFLKETSSTMSEDYCDLIYHFLNFYGNHYDPMETAISLFMSPVTPFYKIPEGIDNPKMTVWDPLNPTKNLTQNAFLIDKILAGFRISFEKLDNFGKELANIVGQFDESRIDDLSGVDSRIILQLQEFKGLCEKNIIESLIRIDS